MGPILESEGNIERYFLPESSFGKKIVSEILVFDNKVIFVPEKKNKKIIVLKDKGIAETIKCLFLMSLSNDAVQKV